MKLRKIVLLLFLFLGVSFLGTSLGMLTGCGISDVEDPVTEEKPSEPVTEEKPTDSVTEEKPSDSVTEEKPTEKVKYTITFVDKDGNTISEKEYEEGSKPSCSYSVSDTDEWDYTFDGWSTSEDGDVLSKLPDVSDDATYYAIVSKVKQQYTITFDTNGGSEVTEITVDYGSEVEAPEKPSKDGYRFIGWYLDEDLEEAVEWPVVLTSDLELYAAWNETVKVGEYLKALLSSASHSPKSYIPEAMLPGYEENLVTEASVTYDFSKNTNVSNIVYGGFGEQWNMVVSNIEQSQTFHVALTTLDSVISSSVVAFNNWFDKNPSDTANYETKVGEYNVTILFENNVLEYILELESVQVHMVYDIENDIKDVRIQLTDGNALKYTISENSYEFGIRYLGVRRAMFKVEVLEDESIKGSIYEYLGLDGLFSTSSCAEFYINDEYVSVVGNKAGALLGFTGYISELYSVETGKLLSYEVQETSKVATFNTLWFNLDDVSGINSIKLAENPDSLVDGFTGNKNLVYINGSSSVFETTKFGGVNTKTLSRRYDIELRTQYFYAYDSENEKYVEIAVEVPMLFIQEEKYDDLATDIKKENSINVTLNINNSDLSKQLEDYDTIIDTFIEIKDLMSVEDILAFIGEKYTFE